MADLKVINLKTKEVVHRVPITNLSESHVERVMLGLLRNMDIEHYCVDDSEIDEARTKLASQDAQG